jgi:hypothetical protein
MANTISMLTPEQQATIAAYAAEFCGGMMTTTEPDAVIKFVRDMRTDLYGEGGDLSGFLNGFVEGFCQETGGSEAVAMAAAELFVSSCERWIGDY